MRHGVRALEGVENTARQNSLSTIFLFASDQGFAPSVLTISQSARQTLISAIVLSLGEAAYAPHAWN